MKKCRTCNEEKEINSKNFKKRKNSKDGYMNQCIKCEVQEGYERNNPNSERSIQLKKLREEKEYLLSQGKKRCYKCDEVKDISSENFYKNKRTNDGFQSTCKSCYVQWQKDNRSKINKKEKERRQDSLYNMMRTIRALVNKGFRDRKLNKNTNASKYLQCDWETLKQHIESQFTEGMSWDNQGEWHFDHYYPLSQAKSVKEMYIYNHYSNLQPLWAHDNLTKNNKVPQGHKEWRKKMSNLLDILI